MAEELKPEVKKKPGRKVGQKETNKEKIARAGEMYRTGVCGPKEICDRLDIKRTTLSSWITRYGWERDLSARVRAAVRRKALSDESVNSLIDEDRAVEDAANEQFSMLCRQKGILLRSLSMIDTLQSIIAQETEKDMEVAAKASHIDSGDKMTVQHAVFCAKALQELISKAVSDTRRVWQMDEKKDERSVDDIQQEAIRLAEGI